MSESAERDDKLEPAVPSTSEQSSPEVTAPLPTFPVPTGTGNTMPSDRLVITNDDLDPDLPAISPGIAPQPATAPPPGLGSFAAPASPPSPGISPSQSVLPPLGPQPVPMPVPVAGSGSGDLLTRLGANGIVAGLVAGLLGAVLGVILSENLKNPDSVIATSAADLRTQSGIWAACFGAGLGAVLMAWDGITSRSSQKAWRDGATGAVIGLAAGFVGGYVAQWLYSNMLKNALNSNTVSDVKQQLIYARVAGWAVMGGLLGGGLGIRGGTKKIVNGLIGGVLGGAVGGLIFQTLNNRGLDSSSPPGFLETRGLGMIITGVAIGLGVGMVERLRRDGWVRIIAGPMTGKEFILYNAETHVGADYRCDIVLAKDSSIAPVHAVFVRDPNGTVSVRAETSAPLTVNGYPNPGGRLRSGDVVGVGASALAYQERAVRT